MSKGVAQIQNCAQASFALVFGNYPGFIFARAANSLGQQHGLARPQTCYVFLTPGKKLCVQNEAVLNHLSQASRHFAIRQGIEHIGIDLNGDRLIKRTDHVFAKRVVDRGLSTHRGIYLGQQGCRHLHEAYAAHVYGCGKTGHIANHTAAKRDDDRAPIKLRPQHRVENQIECFPTFVGLAIRQDNWHDTFTRGSQDFSHPLSHQPLDNRIGDQGNRRGIGGDGLRQGIEPPASNMNRVLSARSGDGYGVHGLFSAEWCSTVWFAAKSARMFSEELAGRLCAERSIGLSSCLSRSII